MRILSLIVCTIFANSIVAYGFTETALAGQLASSPNTSPSRFDFCTLAPTDLAIDQEPLPEFQIFLPMIMQDDWVPYSVQASATDRYYCSACTSLAIQKVAQTLDYDLCETIPIPANGSLLFVGDMDGDQVLDIVLANYAQQMLSVLELVETDLITRFSSTQNRLRGPAVADIDNDGLPEILVGNFSGQVKIWEASGDNEYTQRHSESIGNFIENTRSGDSDGDGIDEFLIARESFPSQVFLIEAHEGTYQNQGSLLGDGGNSSVAGSLDLDGDGLPETVFNDDDYTLDKRKRIYVYENGELIFRDTKQSASSLGDTDGNGLGEIIGGENGTGNLRILESDSHESGSDQNGFVEVFNGPSDGYSARVIDVQGDGQMEFWRVTKEESDQANVLWFASRTDQTFAPIYNSGSLFLNFAGNIRDIQTLDDIDDDGYPEIVVVQGEVLHILEEVR